MLHEKIKKDIAIAMKARDTARLRASRNLLAALTNELVAKKRKPQELLDDDGVLGVIMRLAKQRKDSMEQFHSGGRDDLIPTEQEELTYLKEYLPQMMTKDEIKKIAETKKQETGIDDKAKMGALMGAVMKELKGKADGKDVKDVVEELLQ